MQPGHEDCNHVTIEEKMLCDSEPRVSVRCLHDHKEPVVVGIDLCSPETVGWHCHCCGRVWIDQTYVEGAINE